MHWTTKEAEAREQDKRRELLARGRNLRAAETPESEKLWFRVFLGSVGRSRRKTWEEKIMEG